jgi:hypothetical protein
MMFVVDNLGSFQTDSAVNTADTRNKTKLCRPIAKLSRFKRCVSCVGTKIFSSRTYSISSRKNDTYRLRLLCEGALLFIPVVHMKDFRHA